MAVLLTIDTCCVLPQALVWDLALERDPEEALSSLYVDV
jgi:hypothetical protein